MLGGCEIFRDHTQRFLWLNKQCVKINQFRGQLSSTFGVTPLLDSIQSHALMTRKCFFPFQNNTQQHAALTTKKRDRKESLSNPTTRNIAFYKNIYVTIIAVLQLSPPATPFNI
jgi:hypothetical protein